jgi:hypothetical protein
MARLALPKSVRFICCQIAASTLYVAPVSRCISTVGTKRSGERPRLPWRGCKLFSCALPAASLMLRETRLQLTGVFCGNPGHAKACISTLHVQVLHKGQQLSVNRIAALRCRIYRNSAPICDPRRHLTRARCPLFAFRDINNVNMLGTV